MGALVGAAHVAGSLARLREWAEAATWREIVPLVDVRLGSGGLVDGKFLVRFLRDLGIEKTIESHATPFAAVATDLVTGREVWLQTGPIYEAVRASISIPGILSPHRIDGRWFADGGLTNPVPVSVCRALGAEIIIAVHVGGGLSERHLEVGAEIPPPAPQTPMSRDMLERLVRQLPSAMQVHAAPLAEHLFPQTPAAPGFIDVLSTSLNIMQDHINRTRLAGEPPHVMLVPRLQNFGWMEFHRAKEGIAAGRACVEQALPLLEPYK